MPTLYITEFANTGNSNTAPSTAMAAQPPIAEQIVTIGAGSTQSAAFNAATKFVRLFTDTACGIAFNANPTAGANSARMAANSTEYFGVPQNNAFKVATLTP